MPLPALPQTRLLTRASLALGALFLPLWVTAKDALSGALAALLAIGLTLGALLLVLTSLHRAYQRLALAEGGSLLRRLSNPTSLPLLALWALTPALSAALALPMWGGLIKPDHAAPLAAWAGLVGGGLGLSRAHELWSRWRRWVDEAAPVEIRLDGWRLELRARLPEVLDLAPTRAARGGFQLGDPRFDARFTLITRDPRAFLYLDAARRGLILALDAALPLEWRRGWLSVPLSALDGDPAEIRLLMTRLSALAAEPVGGKLGGRLLEALDARQEPAAVLFHLARSLPQGLRDEGIERAWPRLDWAARLTFAWLPHERRRARLRVIFEAEEAEEAIRAEALDKLMSLGAPREDLVALLGRPGPLQRVALRWLIEGQYCLTEAGLAWLLERSPDAHALHQAVLTMGRWGWHPKLAERTRALLLIKHRDLRLRAIHTLGLRDDEVGALKARMDQGPDAEEAQQLRWAIEQIRDRHAEGAGALTLAHEGGELSALSDGGELALTERGGLSDPEG